MPLRNRLSPFGEEDPYAIDPAVKQIFLQNHQPLQQLDAHTEDALLPRRAPAILLDDEHQTRLLVHDLMHS